MPNKRHGSFLSSLVLLLMVATMPMGYCGQEQIRRELSQLNLFRNIYAIESTADGKPRFTPHQSQFDIFFISFDKEDPENTRLANMLRIGGNSSQAFKNPSPEFYNHLWGGIVPYPFPHKDNLPQKMENLRRPIKNFLLKLVGDGRGVDEIEIIYWGNGRIVWLEEVFFTHGGKSLETRLIRLAKSELRILDNSSEFVFSLFWDAQPFQSVIQHPDKSIEQLDSKVFYVDFSLDSKLLGTPLSVDLRAQTQMSYQKYYTGQHKKFIQQVSKTIDHVEKGTYRDPFDSLIFDHGPDKIPPHFNQWIEFSDVIVAEKVPVNGAQELIQLHFSVRKQFADFNDDNKVAFKGIISELNYAYSGVWKLMPSENEYAVEVKFWPVQDISESISVVYQYETNPIFTLDSSEVPQALATNVVLTPTAKPAAFKKHLPKELVKARLQGFGSVEASMVAGKKPHR